MITGITPTQVPVTAVVKAMSNQSAQGGSIYYASAMQTQAGVGVSPSKAVDMHAFVENVLLS